MENKESIRLELPNGNCLVVNVYNDEIFPSIDIHLEETDGEHEKICMVEYNTERDLGKEVCIGIYSPDSDDTIFYESYADLKSSDLEVI